MNVVDVHIKSRIKALVKGEIPSGYIKGKVGIRPVEWKVWELNKCLYRVRIPVEVELSEQYRQIGIRSHGKGLFYKESVSGLELGNKSVFWIEPECFIVNIVFAWEMAIGKTTQREVGMIASHRFPMYKPKDNKISIDYLTYYFKSPRGKYFLELASPGGAGRNKTLGQTEFFDLKLPFPSLQEQITITNVLSTWDKVIELKEKLTKEKKKQKRGLMQRLLTGEVRLQGFIEEWNEYKIKELLDYEQPTKYIVSEIFEYSKDLTPVLTANKSFIIGSTNEDYGVFNNLPVILFDDFTTDIKYVDFKFKVKSSAIKILSTKNGVNDINFMFEILQALAMPSGDHKRYYISQVQEMVIKIPKIEEQIAIAKIAETMNKTIRLYESELEVLKQQKKGLMQLLLTGIVRISTQEN